MSILLYGGKDDVSRKACTRATTAFIAGETLRHSSGRPTTAPTSRIWPSWKPRHGFASASKPAALLGHHAYEGRETQVTDEEEKAVLMLQRMFQTRKARLLGLRSPSCARAHHVACMSPGTIMVL